MRFEVREILESGNDFRSYDSFWNACIYNNRKTAENIIEAFQVEHPERIYYIKELPDLNEQCANIVCEAIKTLADNPDRLENFCSYLTHCFDKWIEKFANTPEKMAAEFRDFANIIM